MFLPNSKKWTFMLLFTMPSRIKHIDKLPGYPFHPKLLFLVYTDASDVCLEVVLVQQALSWIQEARTPPIRSSDCAKETTLPRTTMCCCVPGLWKLIYLHGRLFIMYV